jgi:hypothetical protein
MDEPCSGGRQRPGRWPGAGRGAARRSAGALPRAGFPGRGGHGWVTGGRVRTRVLRWTRVCAVTGLLAVAGLAAGAGTGTAQAADALNTTAFWSGYEAYPGPFYEVSADFVVPGATCSQGPGETGPFTGFWVGFQGVSVIVQTGFQVTCVSGQPVYTGWHADLLGTSTPISQPMQPGDQVDANVACLFGLCEQTVQDVTQNWSSTVALDLPDPSGFLAAVAAESGDGGVTTGPVQVTNAMMNGTPIGQFDPEAMQQDPANYGGTAGLDPTALDPSGAIFQFYWNGNTSS